METSEAGTAQAFAQPAQLTPLYVDVYCGSHTLNHAYTSIYFSRLFMLYLWVTVNTCETSTGKVSTLASALTSAEDLTPNFLNDMWKSEVLLTLTVNVQACASPPKQHTMLRPAQYCHALWSVLLKYNTAHHCEGTLVIALHYSLISSRLTDGTAHVEATEREKQKLTEVGTNTASLLLLQGLWGNSYCLYISVCEDLKVVAGTIPGRNT